LSSRSSSSTRNSGSPATAMLPLQPSAGATLVAPGILLRRLADGISSPAGLIRASKSHNRPSRSSSCGKLSFIKSLSITSHFLVSPMRSRKGLTSGVEAGLLSLKPSAAGVRGSEKCARFTVEPAFSGLSAFSAGTTPLAARIRVTSLSTSANNCESLPCASGELAANSTICSKSIEWAGSAFGPVAEFS